MYAKSIQIWIYVTAFFRSPINMLSLSSFSWTESVECIKKAKNPCLGRPKVTETTRKAWEWRLLWTYWENSQKRKFVDKVLYEKW